MKFEPTAVIAKRMCSSLSRLYSTPIKYSPCRPSTTSQPSGTSPRQSTAPGSWSWISSVIRAGGRTSGESKWSKATANRWARWWNVRCAAHSPTASPTRSRSSRPSGQKGVEPLLDGLLVATIGRVVIGAVLDRVGQMLLLHLRLLVVVGVAIALAVADLSHQGGGGIAQVQRHRVGARPLDVLLHGRVRRVERIALGRRREIDYRLRQRQIRLGHPDEMRSLLGGDGLGQRLWISEADVLGGKADQPAGHVQGILAGLEHPPQPVQRGIRIAVPETLVQGRDDVVVLLAGAVIQEVLALHRLLDERGGDAPPALLRPGQGGGGLQAVERHPG